MRLPELVAAVHGAFDVPAAMADVAALCEHDRYQASAGIDAAAEYVAARAAEAGLAGVTVLRFPADGARRWWTFAAPPRWTPRRASVHVEGLPVLCYPEQPYALAANSAPTPASTLPVVHWSGAERPDPAGALVVLDGTLPAMLGELVARRAAGVVTDPLAGRFDRAGRAGHASRPGRWPQQVGRIELPAGCPLFAFSATEEQLAALRGAPAARVLVDVGTDTDASTGSAPATLPVVTGVLPGAAPPSSPSPDATWASLVASWGTRDAHGALREGGELLLSAHLCHPRPSANDNASGVAALLGIARAHRALGEGMAVRFVWGPEFVGMAAYLHELVHAGGAPRPVAAVNVDMAGEDQRRCGGPLVIERAPDELPSPLSAVAERCAALIPPVARSYSGAVPCDTWAWRATPYVGASDHAMLAGPPTSCPAISLGHWPDATNHTSADTLDVVDPDELRRTATIAGATIAALRCAGTDRALATDIVDTAVAWAATHVLSALPGSRPSPPPPVAGPSFDPWAPGQAARLLQYRKAVAMDVVRSVRAEHRLTALVEAVDEAFTAPPRDAEPVRQPEPAELAERDVLVVSWDGPMNLRHLAECANEEDRRWLAEVAAHDRGGSYARLLALARGLDERRDRTEVAWWAALTSELAIPVAMASRFLEVLCRTGWATPSRGET